MKSIAIIGAGITGLTAAFYLKRKGFSVTLYEASDHAGGVIRSLRQDGFLAEFGPNTTLETSPKIAQLITDLDLEARRLYANPAAEIRYLVHDQKPVAMPSSPVGFITTPLFSFSAKMAVLREPFVPPRRDGADESVAEFVRRRLNQEFLDRAVDPMVSGIYAGTPDKLSVRHALPRLYEQEQKYGSLIRGQIFGAGERKRRGEVARSRAKMFSFDEGLQVLPDTLAARLGDSIRLNAAVNGLTRTKNGWRLSNVEGGSEFDAVIYCGNAHKLAELQLGKVDLKFFSEVRHPPVASVVLGFRRADVVHPLDGFGMLIPKKENFNILGSIFSSSLFPNRAPKNHVVLTSYIGGERNPGLASRPSEELISLASTDLQALLGVNGKPVFQHVAFYPRAIPQYNVGYGGFKDALTDIENWCPNLLFAGSYRDGVSLGDSIVSGINVVSRLEKLLTPHAS